MSSIQIPNVDVNLENILFQPMVRPGFTNYFQTKNAEDLENRIAYVLTEQVNIKGVIL